MAATDFIIGGQPLAGSPVWADVQPQAQAGGRGVVAIRCSAADAEVLQLFYALAASGERSLRALALTEAVIGVNAASYHAWTYRWQCLEALDSGELFAAEGAFLRRMAAANPKNYQLWNHRRRLALRLGPAAAQEELQFAERCLEEDAKNYHTWVHRQAVVAEFGLWGGELAFTARLIAADVRNNSAWNHRLWALQRGGELPGEQEIEHELRFAADNIRSAPHNESPWHFLRGLAGLAPRPRGLLARAARLHAICQDALAAAPSCSPALSLLADIYAAQAAEARAQGGAAAGGAVAGLAAECCRRLAIADPVRAAYWRWRAAQLGPAAGGG